MAARLAETTRLEAFSDGVFAIAITLLVLEIPVPTHAETAAAGGLARALADRWPSFTRFVISFLTIGIMWVSHHAIFQYVRRTDRRFLLTSLVYVAALAFAPLSVWITLGMIFLMAIFFMRSERGQR
jgi:uncharacterized membrane protein